MCEYSDMFPSMVSEMKGVAGKFGEMNIPLKPEDKQIKKRPYRLNLVYKQRVKA